MLPKSGLKGQKSGSRGKVSGRTPLALPRELHKVIVSGFRWTRPPWRKGGFAGNPRSDRQAESLPLAGMPALPLGKRVVNIIRAKLSSFEEEWPKSLAPKVLGNYLAFNCTLSKTSHCISPYQFGMIGGISDLVCWIKAGSEKSDRFHKGRLSRPGTEPFSCYSTFIAGSGATA
jgi:hypothetical protein